MLNWWNKSKNLRAKNRDILPAANRGSSWFQDAYNLSPHGLAFLRMGVGLAVLVEGVERLVTFENLNSSRGLFPTDYVWESLNKFLIDGPTLPSAFFLLNSDGGQRSLVVLQLILGAAVLFGAAGRGALLGLLYLACSSNLRMYFYLKGGDTILPILITLCICLPVRQVLAVRRHSEKTFAWQALGYISLVVTMYLFIGTAKLNSSWEDGSAILSALRSEYVTTRFGIWLSNFELLTIISPKVPWIEILGALLLFLPFKIVRIVVCLFFISFHLGLALSFNLGNLSPLMISLWIGLLPKSVFTCFRKLSPLKFSNEMTSSAEQSLRGPKLRLWLVCILVFGVALANVSRIPLEPTKKLGFMARYYLLQFGIRGELNYFTNVPIGLNWFEFRVHNAKGNVEAFDLFNNRWIGAPSDSRPENIRSLIPARRYQALYECLFYRACGPHLNQLKKVLCERARDKNTGQYPNWVEAKGFFIPFKSEQTTTWTFFAGHCAIGNEKTDDGTEQRNESKER